MTKQERVIKLAKVVEFLSWAEREMTQLDAPEGEDSNLHSYLKMTIAEAYVRLGQATGERE